MDSVNFRSIHVQFVVYYGGAFAKERERPMTTETRVNIMVVDDNIRWAQGLEETYAGAHVDFRPRAWLRGTRETTIKRIRPDVILWDCTESDEEILDLVKDMHRLAPSLPMLLVVDFKQDSLLRRFAEIEEIDLVRSPADIEEVVYRVRRLLRGTHRRRRSSRAVQARRQELAAASPVGTAGDHGTGDRSHAFFPHLALDLYAPQSGRLDARRVGALFGIKLADIARLLKQKLPTLSKTPDAPSLQSGLIVFQRIGLALARLVGSREGIRIWMNAPNPQLEDRTPLSVVLEGQGEVIAEMLEDMLVGQPA